MFENKCLGRINYEATPAAILLGGVIVSFMVDFLSHRLFSRRQQDDDERQISNDLVKIFALECGILFHSVCKSSNQQHGHGNFGWPTSNILQTTAN